ncbi:cholesterol 25-hydroxylase-like protein 1, member 2 [Lampetra fluviatilis]
MGHQMMLEAVQSARLCKLLESWTGEESLLQPLWDILRLNYGHTLRSPIFPAVLSVMAYYVFCLLFTAVGLVARRLAPHLRHYKIQASKEEPSLRVVCDCVALTIYNNVVFVLPATVAQWYWRPAIDLPEKAPGLFELCHGVLACLLLFDFQYFAWHLLHHRVRWLYRTFHAVHHECTVPFAWSTQYMGGWELMSVGLWTTIDPIVLHCHLLTTWTFMLLNVYLSIEDHSGYDLPWGLHHLLPRGLYGGAPHHDLHHQKPTKNFAPYFCHWDKIFGTSVEATPMDKSPQGSR